MSALNIKYLGQDGLTYDIDIEFPADYNVCWEYVKREYNAKRIISIIDRATGRRIFKDK